MYSSLFRVGCLLFSTGAAVQMLNVEPSEAQGKAVAAKKREKTLLYIGVNTAAGNVNERQGIRDCWFKHALMQGANPPVVAKFMVAKPDPGSGEEQALAKDMAAHPDEFIQVDAPEGYRNLMHKSIAFFKWAGEDQTAEYYMKLDDDNFPNIQIMYDAFTKNLHEGKRYTYAGEIIYGWHAVPYGKYAQDPDGWYPGTAYPNYCSGDGYVISGDLAAYAFGEQYSNNSKQILDNEDVNSGLWVAKAVDMGIDVNYQWLPERCDFSCNRPIGVDAERCCARDKHDEGVDYNYHPVGKVLDDSGGKL